MSAKDDLKRYDKEVDEDKKEIEKLSVELLSAQNRYKADTAQQLHAMQQVANDNEKERKKLEKEVHGHNHH